MKKFLFVCLLYLVPVLALSFGCTSDPETPIGAEFVPDGLNPSEPGQVFQDTMFVESGDTSFVVNAAILSADQMLLGRQNEVESWMILRPDLSEAGDDTLKRVETAEIRLRLVGAIDSLNAYFIELAESFADGDTLLSIQLGDTIPDDTGTNVDRVMTFFPPEYELEPSVVEGWLRGDEPNNGFAVVLNDTTTTRRIAYATTQNSDEALRPTLRVRFTDDSETSYPISADGTFCIEMSTTSNLLLSDGVTRRVYVPLDLTSFDPRILLHDANLVFHMVPESTTGGDLAVTLYAPESTDINDPGILTGIPVTATFLNPDLGLIKLPIRNIVSQLIADDRFEAALVLQYSLESTSIRGSEFYAGSAPDSLKPAYRFTFSTAPEFGK